ncbi:hypothetical protein [Sediminicola sp. 1XM1-17]|uniref:hypothetical protein n=1 Tax=Sediminicola sp. 1XM1-17 TaxID=3127702 RepID=UPI003077D0F3
MKTLKQIYLFPILMLISCGGGDSGGTPVVPPPEPVPSPLSATLIFPENNKECTEGTVENETQSTVNFQWNSSENTDSYEVNLKNLNTNNSQRVPASTNAVLITLNRGTPYEWSVTSKATGTNTTAQSEVWKFYNQGPGIENYAPFPADAVFPKRGANLASTNQVTLQWTGSDIDDDIASYSILLDTLEIPVAELGTTTENSIEATVSPGQTYFWQVITIDSQGNSSNSEIFSFRINS